MLTWQRGPQPLLGCKEKIDYHFSAHVAKLLPSSIMMYNKSQSASCIIQRHVCIIIFYLDKPE